MNKMNIYLCGVGGQGIGLLSEVLTNACIKAGHQIRGCDTHGLAQRGGVVVSHLRLGEGAHTPRVSPGTADVVVALERLEAMRAAQVMLKEGGTVVYYDAVYQPWHVRSGEFEYPEPGDLETAVQERKGHLERVFIDKLSDPRMQNVALLGRVASKELIEGVNFENIEEALRAVVPVTALETNLKILKRFVRD